MTVVVTNLFVLACNMYSHVNYVILIQALVEKDWLSFGHPFSDRLGMPTLTGSGNMPFELPRQSSTGSFSSSPMRQAPGSLPSQAPNSAHTQASNHSSPIFLQVGAHQRNSFCVAC